MMTEQMEIKFKLIFAAVATEAAREMLPEMSLERTTLGGRIGAVLALERFLTSVESGMLDQITPLLGDVFTSRAWEPTELIPSLIGFSIPSLIHDWGRTILTKSCSLLHGSLDSFSNRSGHLTTTF